MQAKLGKILCSTPSNIAIDNFAERIDRTGSSVADRANKDKQPDALDRARRRLVVRGYKPLHEYAAFLCLLENPSTGDDAAPGMAIGASKWKLHLSVAFWLLAVLRSPAVRPLHADDSKAPTTRRRWLH